MNVAAMTMSGVKLGLCAAATALAGVVFDAHASAQSAAARAALNDETYREVLPDARVFESVSEKYDYVRGYTDVDGERRLVGFVFLTRDLGAQSRGYNGVIHILVGMNVRGRLTGVKIVEHYEAYGYRSINLPEYPLQFAGKSVLDPFEVGNDIDGYSGATITTAAATKSIRNASRRMAREFLVKK